jgi:hypothetical protein
MLLVLLSTESAAASFAATSAELASASAAAAAAAVAAASIASKRDSSTALKTGSTESRAGMGLLRVASHRGAGFQEDSRSDDPEGWES